MGADIGEKMTTAAQKAVEILGYPPVHDVDRIGPGDYGDCNICGAHRPEEFDRGCTFPLPVLVAAHRGTLRREHTGAGRCFFCNTTARTAHDKSIGAYFLDFDPIGPCHPPLDAALAWELLVEAAQLGAELVFNLPEWKMEAWTANMARNAYVPMVRTDDPIEAVARLWVRLKDEGLLDPHQSDSE